MLSFNTEEREALLDQRWLEVLIAVLGGRMGHVVTGKRQTFSSFILGKSFLFRSA